MKRIVILFAALFIFVSCGMTCSDVKTFYMYISVGNNSCECIYDDTIYSQRNTEQGIPIIITRDTVLRCDINFHLASSVGKDKITDKTRYARFRRLSGDGECDIYMLTNNVVKYKGEEYFLRDLYYNIIWNNDTSLMTKEDLYQLIKDTSSKYSLSAGEESITVPITYMR